MGIITLIMLLALVGLEALAVEPATEIDPGFAVFRDQCMACHLETGMGIEAMNAPSIAGLPRWYVADQLRKFRSDRRGYHNEDVPGKLMQANAMVLDERTIAFLGRHIENLPYNLQRNTLGRAITEESESLYEAKCSQCHGLKADGDRSLRTPPLTSQQDWYLLKQWDNFKSGKRLHIGFEAVNTVSDTQLEAMVAWIAELPVAED